MKKENLYTKLPDTPGVYLMKDARGRIIYIGKAGNLKRRVSSYFQKAHDYRIEKLVSEIRTIDHRTTDSALEALILESALIKKHQPPYNIREKDDKSFLYVEVTKEKFPRVLLVRGKELAEKRRGTLFGPFTFASELKEALRILRRIFPWNTHGPEELAKFKESLPAKAGRRRACFNYEIGNCPGACAGTLAPRDYARTVRYLKDFFEGKKQVILRSLERDMRAAAKALEFEKAARLRGQVFALRHIRDTALINKSEFGDFGAAEGVFRRIEGYDISNISGTSAVGSMVVFMNGEPDKNEYRKFRIRTVHQSDDTAMLREVIERRLGRIPPAGGWTLPDLLLIDGGKGQVRTVERVLAEHGVKLPVVGIAKGPERKKNEFIGTLPKWASEQTLIRVRDEAHRFAVAYHRVVRGHRSLH
jgi:excinuclease ABC subunit C